MDGFQLGLCPTYWRSVYCRRQQREHSSMDSTWKPKPSAHTYKHWISEVECRTRTQQILVALLLLGRAVCVENITLEEEPPKTRRNVAYHPPPPLPQSGRVPRYVTGRRPLCATADKYLLLPHGSPTRRRQCVRSHLRHANTTRLRCISWMNHVGSARTCAVRYRVVHT